MISNTGRPTGVDFAKIEIYTPPATKASDYKDGPILEQFLAHVPAEPRSDGPTFGVTASMMHAHNSGHWRKQSKSTAIEGPP